MAKYMIVHGQILFLQLQLSHSMYRIVGSRLQIPRGVSVQSEVKGDYDVTSGLIAIRGQNCPNGKQLSRKLLTGRLPQMLASEKYSQGGRGN
jgi:hypothetical protein